MALVRCTPASELTNLHGAMDRLFDQLVTGRARDVAEGRAALATVTLPVDVEDLNDAYRIVAPVPGFQPEEVEVTYSEGVLVISAQHSTETPEPDARYLRREIPYANYFRRIQLPGDVKAEQVKASFENGMLRADLPRTGRQKPVKVPITSGEKKQPVGGTARR